MLKIRTPMKWILKIKIKTPNGLDGWVLTGRRQQGSSLGLSDGASKQRTTNVEAKYAEGSATIRPACQNLHHVVQVHELFMIFIVTSTTRHKKRNVNQFISTVFIWFLFCMIFLSVSHLFGGVKPALHYARLMQCKATHSKNNNKNKKGIKRANKPDPALEEGLLRLRCDLGLKWDV